MKNETFFKMSIIPTIQMLETKIGMDYTRFENLNKFKYSDLEVYRDNLLIQYNNQYNNQFLNA
jgi:hypothetical protein